MDARKPPLIIKNSPIEFVVAGPAGGRDRILIRSEHASLDLVALAVQSPDKARDYPRADPLALLFGVFGSARQLNIVSSIPIADLRPETDPRKSKLTFAWKGFAGYLGRDQVRDALNSSVPDLFRALEANDHHDLELSIAPVVLACSEANEKKLRSQRFMWFALAVYALTGIGAAVYWLVHYKTPMFY